MGLVEELMKNNYLITPSAFYLLNQYYGEGFNLGQLIKFAKSRGTFVIDSKLAEDFLSSLGLRVKLPLEDSTISAPETGTEDELDIASSEVTGDLEPQIGEKSSNSQVVLEESVESAFESSKVGGYISTGEPLLSGAEESSDNEIGEEEAMSFEGGSFISTGEVETSDPGDGGGLEPVDEGSFADGETQTRPLDVSNGDSSGYADSGEYYGNGNGVKPKIVYGDYGVPIAYVEEEVPVEEKSYSVYSDLVIKPKEGFSYRARDIKDDWDVVFDVKNVKFEVPKAKNAAGKEGEIIVQVYSKYFKSRLRKMKRIIRENPEVGGIIDIAKLSYVQTDEDVAILGLVNSKRETKKGYMFEIEDGTGTIKVFVNRNNEESKKFFQIMPDSVVAFRGRYSGRNIFFADKIFLPDVPKFKREKPPLEEKVYAILLSDIHVGSNKFCEKAFERFLEWLNGDVNNKKEEELVSRIKYMIIAGDVVDGIGIYPGQYNELEIPDIFDQYEALANLLRNVPEHITMFIGPGNHDAARTALPQPGFYDEYARPLKKLKNAVMISNPAVVRLHGRDFLVAHGRSIEDVVSFIPNRSHHRPAEAMVDLLKLRHLAPTFGEKVPIAPDPEDTLVIESVPDLFQAGHVHVMEYKIYNGVFLINTGTWQAQTEFQKMVNIVPTPARVPIIDVETARLRAVVRFDQFCEGV
ncbi:MAG: DNA-directed DNA polymerase II small subunit [Thermococcus sp.]|nr:DNA-directed DNA polymerase II small subunit [Thermococcus sp.]